MLGKNKKEKKKKEGRARVVKTLRNSCSKVCPMQELHLIYFHS